MADRSRSPSHEAVERPIHRSRAGAAQARIQNIKKKGVRNGFDKADFIFLVSCSLKILTWPSLRFYWPLPNLLFGLLSLLALRLVGRQQLRLTAVTDVGDT